MKKNKSRYAILGLLTMGPMSGYDVKKKFEKIAANFWKESYGQIYPILKRLTAEGLTIRSIQRQTGKPDRHVYELTQQGSLAIKEWLLEPVGHHVGRHEILLKLILGPLISVSDNIRQLQHFRKMHEKELADLTIARTQLEKEFKGRSQLPYWQMTVRFGELVNEALLEWSGECLERLEQMNDR